MLATASAQVCVPLGHSSLYLQYVLFFYVLDLIFTYAPHAPAVGSIPDSE